MARGASGTRCSRRAFMRSAGIVQDPCAEIDFAPARVECFTRARGGEIKNSNASLTGSPTELARRL